MPLRPIEPSLDVDVALRPEVLAPVGDREGLAVALAAGADAVYFGLDDGFNARARAENFSVANLPDTVAQIHRAGARAYLTLNTLLFESEIVAMERVLRAVASAGVDAIIVQDPAVCLLAREICPDLELHASTQMTISSAEGARFSKDLGVTRVVVPRELNVTEIKRFREGTDLELEVFIHGALCMSWSGQCLTSEAWGGRSANRGQCAQSCRMPYDLIVDGEQRPLGEVRYLLSPKDLAGFRAVPALMEIGVHTLKIEGRLKGPSYVATSVTGLQRWIDAIESGAADTDTAQHTLSNDLATMMVAYSRGFSDGFLGGSDHQTLVDGRFPKSRGAYLGVVTGVEGSTVLVERGRRAQAAPGEGRMLSPLPELGGAEHAASGAEVAAVDPRAGMGVVFDAGRPEDTREPGGPIFAVRDRGDVVELGFGRPGPDLRRVNPGDRVWITGDPELTKQARRLAESTPEGRVPIDLVVRGALGEPLRVEAHLGDVVVAAESDDALGEAAKRPLDEKVLRDKLGALGGTPFALDAFDASEVGDGLYLPMSALKPLRRRLVAALLPRLEAGAPREVATEDVAPWLHATLASRVPAPRHVDAEPIVVPLVRTDEQLDAVIAAGLPEVELDWMEMVGLGKAFARARAAGLKVNVATVRVQKPGEEGFDRRVGKLSPDGVVVRHWGGLVHFRDLPVDERPILHGDFSLNVTNSLTAQHLLGWGLDTFTAAHDLDETQLFALLDGVPADRCVVTVHHHISTFHTEHCVYAAHLSEGRDWRSCGRPCDEHRIGLRDHLGNEHPVIVDVGCRNTIFNAHAQSAASLVPRLLDAGVRRLRVEFVWESGDVVTDVLTGYRDLVAGRITPPQLLERIDTHEQFGVTLGTMRTLR